MYRRCLFAILCFTGACGGGSAAKRISDPPPAFRGAVVYVVDTLRADHLSAYGYARETSPVLDAFAREGVLFSYCLSQSSWTKPSTASILTGLYPEQHAANTVQRRMPDEVTTLAERLSEAGVATAGFYANSWLRPKHGLHQGFETFEFVSRDTPELTRTIVDRALAFLRAIGDTPFFCYVHVIDPHAPYDPSAPYDTLFGEEYTGDVRGDYGLNDPAQSMDQLTPADTQHLVDLYDGCIAQTDAEFGRFLDGLKDAGIHDDTLILFVSDHGEEFYEHRSWRHNGQLYDEVVNVPLIAHFPDLEQRLVGHREPGVVQQVDITPTVLGAFGLLPSSGLPGLRGKDLRAYVEEEGSVGTGFVEVDHEGMYRKAVVFNQRKYIRAWAPFEREFLYDLRADPGERVNLLEEDPELGAVYRRVLEHFIAQTGSGTHVLFQNGGREVLEVEIMIFADVDYPRVSTIYTEESKLKGDLRDGRVVSDDVDWEGRSRKGTRVFFQVEPGDGDGLKIVPVVGEKSLDIYARIGGEFIEARYVRLGSDGRPLAELPARMKAEISGLWSAPMFPSRADLGGDPYRLRIWTSEPSSAARELEFTPDEIEAFQALGYFGNE